MEQELIFLVEPLLNWYQKNKRILPWRENKNAYHIWISEIMLQQTRIEAVKAYYHRFLEKLPTIHDLANVPEEKLLKLWEGLGYYNRARNLQKAAKIIEEKWKGKMPTTYRELITLPGIGEYTAGAIASIAYQEEIPAVDGNVLRVISRVTASRKDVLLPETKKEITQILKSIMQKNNLSGDFNEALMELGELVCLPNGEPNCSNCPLNQQCKAYQNNLTAQIPVRQKKVNRKQEEKTVFVLVSSKGNIAIQKRTQKGVLSGMYELPNISKKIAKEEIEQTLKTWNLQATDITNLGEYQHIFTHITWNMTAYQIKVQKENNQFIWINKKQLENEYALPTAFKKLIK